MKPLTGKEFAKVIERFGREYKRTTASHDIYRKPGNPFNVSIPIHGSKHLKIGLQAHHDAQAPRAPSVCGIGTTPAGHQRI